MAQRYEVGRDVRVLVAERLRVETGNVEAVEDVVREDLVADERQVEVARAGPVRVEWGAVLPAVSRHAAAAKDYARALGQRLAQNVAELVVEPLVAVEREPHDALAFRRLGQ